MRRLCVAAMVMAMAACTTGLPGDGPADVPIEEPAAAFENVQWNFLSLGGAPVAPIEGERGEPHALFEAQRVAGTTGCNRFMGGYALQGAALAFEALGTTRMACPGPLMERERAIMAALSAVASHKIEGDTLSLIDASGSTVAVLKAKR